MREAEIQRRITEYLEKHGWIVNKILQCTHNGWTDLEAFRHYPEMVFIEVKRPGQKPEPLQQYRHQKLRERGFSVIVATSVDDVKHLS